MNNIQEAILQTLSYHARFSYPLTLPELHRYLITAVPVSQSRVEDGLKKLIKAKKIKQSSLTTPTSRNFATLRLLRQSFSAQKLLIARRAAHLLSLLPTIKLICVTGSLAMKNCDESDDIDLMIVTSANTLWLTRPLVVFLVSLFFRRRLPPYLPKFPNPPRFPNEICLNLWLDTTALEIPQFMRSLRVAHELAQMKPILNKNRTYEKMLSANPWLKKYLANYLSDEPGFFHEKSAGTPEPRSRALATHGRRPWEQVSVLLGQSLNFTFYILQLLYMSPRRTTEKVGLHFAFFHPKSPTSPKSPKTTLSAKTNPA